jgi:hypothetical protein
VLRLLRSFDAEHFYYLIKNGYNNEKNAAFFPGYPMNLIFLMFPFAKNYVEIVDFGSKLFEGSLTSVLIYYFGRLTFANTFFALSSEKLEVAKNTKY